MTSAKKSKRALPWATATTFFCTSYANYNLYLHQELSGTFLVIQICHTKPVYKPASHEASLFFIGCQSSPSLPVAVKPCNGISQLLHFNTVRALQNSSHDVILSPWAHLQGSGSSLIFTQQSYGPFVLLSDILLHPMLFLKDFEQSIWGAIVELFHSLDSFLIAISGSIIHAFHCSACCSWFCY